MYVGERMALSTEKEIEMESGRTVHMHMVDLHLLLT